MTETLATEPKRASRKKGAAGLLFFLELSGRIHTMRPDGSDHRSIVTDCRLPDGIAVDVAAATSTGPTWLQSERQRRFIERADIDGKNCRSSFRRASRSAEAVLDRKNGKLYWCDREGMRVMRS